MRLHECQNCGGVYPIDPDIRGCPACSGSGSVSWASMKSGEARYETDKPPLEKAGAVYGWEMHSDGTVVVFSETNQNAWIRTDTTSPAQP